MVFAVLNLLIALLLGYGALQELIARGLRNQEFQPFLLSFGGLVVALLFGISGIALWRRQANARRLVIIAAVASIVFHVYAALPPHRQMGFVVLIIGIGYGLVLLAFHLRPMRPNAVAT
ncbi:MAG TPA: hypothetical protein VN643_13465 [Pyrinomonadaceae bacterium]|nr:hypothetical protein [Pyrinomonadaceae bacterium]